jgi:hypothetical protein
MNYEMSLIVLASPSFRMIVRVRSKLAAQTTTFKALKRRLDGLQTNYMLKAGLDLGRLHKSVLGLSPLGSYTNC